MSQASQAKNRCGTPETAATSLRNVSSVTKRTGGWGLLENSMTCRARTSLPIRRKGFALEDLVVVGHPVLDLGPPLRADRSVLQGVVDALEVVLGDVDPRLALEPALHVFQVLDVPVERLKAALVHVGSPFWRLSLYSSNAKNSAQTWRLAAQTDSSESSLALARAYLSLRPMLSRASLE